MFVSSNRRLISELLGTGLSMAEIARRTGLAYSTVAYHRDRLALGEQRRAADPAAQPLSQRAAIVAVTTRREVQRLLAAGLARSDVARELELSKSTVTYHARRLGLTVDPRPARRYDWSVIQRRYDAGHSVRECCAMFGFSSATWSKAVSRGAIVARPTEMPIEELLARGAGRNRNHIKRRLIKAGLLAAKCRVCGIDRWRGESLALQLHHVNGDGTDNRLENLALLCPNCHSQTDTWGGRNGNGKRGSLSASGAQVRAAEPPPAARSRRAAPTPPSRPARSTP